LGAFLIFSALLFLVTALMRCAYWLWFYYEIRVRRRSQSLNRQNQYTPSVTVIVCHKNDWSNLQRLIPVVLSQDYPNFEFIIADDFSDPDIKVLLEDSKVAAVKIIHSTKDSPGKKTVLSQAIHETKNELILVTDADCIPGSNSWISSMVSSLDNKKDFVLGYSPVSLDNKSWFLQFVSYENWLTAVQYFSYAMAGIPYMGVGRNLLFRKSVFLNGRGFEHHDHLISGDDDMFVQQHAHAHNTACNLNKESFVYTKPAKTWKEWLHQKKRHSSTSLYYKSLHKILLFLFAGSHVAFYFSFLAICFFSINLAFWASWSVIGFWMFQYICAGQIRKKIPSAFNNDRWPQWDVVMMVYYLVLALNFNFDQKKIVWKS
jgi:glycosyltransferase involved in cell wall biosynthesis